MTAETIKDIPLFWPVLALACGLAASILGGMVGGIATGGRALGVNLAATMGGFYGPLAAVPGIVIGLIVLALLHLH